MIEHEALFRICGDLCARFGLGIAGCWLTGRNTCSGCCPVEIAVKQLTIQLQRLINSLKKLHLRRADGAIGLRQVRQETCDCALCFDGQGIELFLQTCERWWLLELDSQMCLET